MDAPELARSFPLHVIGNMPLEVMIEAEPEERAALAKRFDLLTISQLNASAKLFLRDGQPVAEGRLRATLAQACVATGEQVVVKLDQPFKVRFIDEDAAPSVEEIELSFDEYDDMPLIDGHVDLGEAVAQSLALTLDPFPRSPNAAQVLRAAGVVTEGEEPRGAFAGLKDFLGG
jgi:uncharacterized metal-binding protein YceD (DUF177 family)